MLHENALEAHMLFQVQKVNYFIKFKSKNSKKQNSKWFALDMVLFQNYIGFVLIEFFQCGTEAAG